MSDIYSLERFFRPRSVAIVGASPQAGSPRNAIVKVLLKHGFEGRVYPVSPTHAEVEGLATFKSVAELPETPDVALVITPAHTVPDIVAQCGVKGIRHVIVFSAGFEETEAGKVHAARLVEAAARCQVTVMGPNCQGVWSVRNKSMLTYSPALQNLDAVQHAPIAVVSQSGALAGAIGNAMQRNGIGCSYMVSVGNETCLDALEVLDWVVDQDDVRVVALYIEGLNDAHRMLGIAQKARRRDVQIVVLKAGRSAMGQQATASHTGKIASSHSVYADVLEQAGVMSVDSLVDLLLAVEVLSFMRAPRASGDPKGGISVLSSSGGAGALLADHSSHCGVPLTEFGDATTVRLEALLPDFARKANPIDLTGQINTVANLFRDTCHAIADDPRTEAIVVQYASSGRRYLQEDAAVFKALGSQLPVIVSFVGETMAPEARRAFREAGVLLAADPSTTMQALSWLYRRMRYRALPAVRERVALVPRAAPSDWDRTMRFCEDGGITPARWTVLGAGDRAAQACADMALPLVVKVLPSEAEHKTELGLVRLRVGSFDEVDLLAAEFRARLGRPGARILVQEMVGEGVEVVLSCLRETDFGPIISLGTGGVAIELYRDVAHLALPVTSAQVRAALHKLKLWTLLQGFRGKPAADVDALVNAAVAFGDQFLAASDIREFEINPLIVGAQGQGLRAVDALVVAR
ncbi:MAG TPA: acetate--CoA ligase family protein [Ideonella sp.]|uniref:acetate--CoA ligase family protein n=1 Tax=Ideonella sp. TaxID=1929293 RepID=UPI002CE88471|nr:acetate--CoA ligase family protein [Ideonella sp.]HSI47073.1 acetate--CoA ligase family protein [Ideonella sp.]